MGELLNRVLVEPSHPRYISLRRAGITCLILNQLCYLLSKLKVVLLKMHKSQQMSIMLLPRSNPFYNLKMLQINLRFHEVTILKQD